MRPATCELFLSSQSTARSPDRRHGADRRRGGWPALWNSLYRSRRRRLRRPEDADGAGYYLDVMPRAVLLAASIVILCCCADAAFTLRLLGNGASEVNPVMRGLLDIDTRLFLGVKFTVTALGVLILASHAHFRLLRVLRGRHALYGAAVGYLTLNTYQIVLLNL